MIDLPYFLIIEATDKPDYFGFYSPELKGFSGIGHSIEDCIDKARCGMKEHLALLKEQNLPIPSPNNNPKIIIQNKPQVCPRQQKDKPYEEAQATLVDASCGHDIIAKEEAHANTITIGDSSSKIKEAEDYQDQNIPRSIGNYTILKALGKGGMGRVYLGQHEKSGEKVALKLLLRTSERNFLDYFLREASLLMQLNHPNIVKFKGQGNYQGNPYLAMEFIEGQSLEKIVQQRPLSARHAIQIVYYVVDALEYLQKYHIVHRDIKPDNILIETQTNAVKLVDLGVGKVIGESYGLSQTGTILGTPFYMAPEQIKDSKHIDHRADIYAVGATLYCMLTGTPPYQEFAKTHLTLFHAKLSNRLIPLMEKCPNLPSEVVQITEKAMAHDVEQRYQSAIEMKKDVLACWQSYKK